MWDQLEQYHSLCQSEPEPTNNAPWRMNGKWTANRFLLGSSSCFFCYLSTNQLPNRWVVKTVLPYVESIYLPNRHLSSYIRTYYTWLPSYTRGYPRWNQILTQLTFIHNWVMTAIQWMVHWWVPVHSGPQAESCIRPSSSLAVFRRTSFFFTKLPTSQKSWVSRASSLLRWSVSLDCLP
jgi:hypothetical protein